jgi:hypothetical protein
MKKVIITLLITLIIIISIFSFYLFYEPNLSSTDLPKSVLAEKILNNSSWITLTKEDLNGYLNGTYTESVISIAFAILFFIYKKASLISL